MVKKQEIEFSKIYERYKEPFIRFAISFVRDSLAAENLFTDAIVDYWTHRQDLPEDTNIPAYILTSVRNKCLNHLRNQRNKLKFSENSLIEEERELEFRINSLENMTIQSLFTSEINEIVLKTLNTMPPTTRRIFELSRYSHMKNAEIAQSLGISVKNVEYHIGRVLKALRVSLRDYLLVFYIFFF